MADLSTTEGRNFANRYNSGQTTLVFFDRGGNFLHQQYGVPTDAQLRMMIDSTFGLGNASGGYSRQQSDPEKIRRQYDDTAKRIIDSMGR